MLAPLQRKLRFGLARRAFHSQHDLLRGLGLLPEHRLGLTTVTTLLAIVTTLTLREKGGL